MFIYFYIFININGEVRQYLVLLFIKEKHVILTACME
jgi:hypothetical protein